MTTTQPAPLVCARCAAEHPYTWVVPQAAQERALRAAGDTTTGGRWAAPSVSPCRECRSDVAAETLEAELVRRLEGARVPPHLRGRTFEGVVQQLPDEPVEDWRGRVRMLAGSIGVLHHLVKPILGLRRWPYVRAGDKLSAWFILTGEPGTGKSTLLGAVARRILTAVERKSVVLYDYAARLIGADVLDDDCDADELIRRKYIRSRAIAYTGARVRTVVYCTVEDLVERERLSWKGDPTPLYRVSNAEVVLLDELAARDTVSSVERDTVAKLVAYRYDNHLATGFASNRTWDELRGKGTRPLYGGRIGERLWERTNHGKAVLELTGGSWR